MNIVIYALLIILAVVLAVSIGIQYLRARRTMKRIQEICAKYDLEEENCNG